MTEVYDGNDLCEQVETGVENSDWTPYNSNLHMKGIKVRIWTLLRCLSYISRSWWTPHAQS